MSIIGSPQQCQARCGCKVRSPVGNRGDIEEWMFRHHEAVERVRRHLEGRNPSVKKTLAWFRSQEANTDNPPQDRELWKRLADEIEAFARSDKEIAAEQLALW
jgi:hypothetical protein